MKRSPLGAAVLAGLALVAWGNGLVLVADAADAAGANGELVTLAAQVLLVATAVGLALARGGFSREDLGLRIPAGGRLPTALLVTAAIAIPAGLAAAVLRRAHCGDPAFVARLLVATAVGEELLFRGVLFAIWRRTTASGLAQAAANIGFFTLWHVAGAFEGGVFMPLEVIGPAAGGVALLAARRHFDSVFAPAALHGAANLSGWVLTKCWQP